MTLNQKSLKFSLIGPVFLNFCIYFFISSVIYYLFTLNITLVKLTFLFSLFVLFFYFSFNKTEFLLQRMKLKNIIILSKFILGIINFSAAILIYNKCSLSSVSFYLLILSTGVLYAVLNKAYIKYFEKTNKNNQLRPKKDLIFKFNLEKLLIVILAASTTVYIQTNLIPLILGITAVYYFLSAYINTFQQI